MERMSMLFMFLMAILFQRIHSTDHTWSALRIDCGASTDESLQEGTTWESDDDFIKTGQNKNVSTAITPQEMTTLRSFPDGNKNCYKFKLVVFPNKYLIRAGFYYGNYDGLSKPPVFDLQLNGQFWTRISTTSSVDEVQHEEMIFRTRRTWNELCLVRLSDDVPFISSIEAFLISDGYYKLMSNHSILRLQSRISFGGDADVGLPSQFIAADPYNRIWKLKQMPDYQNMTSLFIPLGNSFPTENYPPNLLLADAITPKNTSNSTDSISLWIPIPLYLSPTYFVFYFQEPAVQYSSLRTTYIRRIKIYVDGREMGITEVPQNYTCQVVSLYPVTVQGPATNVTLVQAEGSTFPPILNGMEVFASMKASNGGQSHHWSSMVLLVFLIFGVLMSLIG